MKTGITYLILRPITRFALGMYFSRIEYAGLDNIPMDAPVIIASNHPSSFLEACVYACIIPKPIYFLTRGDMMKNPYLKWFFNQTNQISIFRFRDGMKDMRKNQKSLEKCKKVLADNGRLVIFVEGGTKLEKKLKPLQKGAARIALDSILKNNLSEVYLIPTGINFENPLISGKYCCLRFGQAITMNQADYKKSENARDYIESITNQLYQELKPHVIHVNSQEEEDGLNKQIRSKEKKIKNPIFSSYLNTDSTLTRDLLLTGNVAPNTAEKTKKSNQNFIFNTLKYLFAFPTVLAHSLTQKFISSKEFQAPVKIGIGMLFYLLYFVLLLILLPFSPKIVMVFVCGLIFYILTWRIVGVNKDWSISI